MTTMIDELNEIRDVTRHKFISADDLAFMDGENERLRRAGIQESAMRVGQVAPDFTLPDATGKAVRLSHLLQHGPVVLTFYRGGWCPYCNVALRHLQKSLAEFTQAGATLVAISPQTPDNTLSTVEKDELTFPVLSDLGNIVARSFGVVFTLPDRLLNLYRTFGHPLVDANGDTGGSELPVPASFVIDQRGRIQYAFVDPEYSNRATPEELLASLKRLVNAC